MNTSWWLDACQPLDNDAMEQARTRQQQLTKPAGSLGQLEALAITLAGLQGRERPTLERVAIGLFAGDHGVVEEGISAYLEIDFRRNSERYRFIKWAQTSRWSITRRCANAISNAWPTSSSSTWTPRGCAPCVE